ncbi:MAG: hypothetical protein HW390_939 [Candidatus Brocadiaceae bacterium]|nr:hypothetical protein [Candidatus Brocadiaceae bacterium]
MAFQKTKSSSFYQFLKTTAKGSHPELRVIAENFILEERLTGQREDSYESHIAAPANVGDWQEGHEGYVAEKINVVSGTPETFTAQNQPNLISKLDENQYLVRLENATRLGNALGLTNNELIDYLSTFIKNPGDKDAPAIVEKILADWNKTRDHRPVFVGFWDEVKDLMVDPEGKDRDAPEWANRLRDRFGLGHYDPDEGEPIPVVLLRYRVSDVINGRPADPKFAAVPNVLDSKWSPFFCPTPVNGWNEGQSLDLTAGNKDEYALNCEIVHRYIAYRASYFYRAGWITKSPGRTCEEARRIHFSLLQNDYKYFSEL